MKIQLLQVFAFVVLLITSCDAPKEQEAPKVATPFDEAPAWAQEVVWYEIAVERFRNGDPTNDQTAADLQDTYPGFIPEGWQVTPWTHDWYKPDPYFANITDQKDFYGNKVDHFGSKVQLRRYGGDLQGVLDQIDYIDSLGVTAIYFRPLNDAPSLHKYDARNWRHIDRNFGPNPQKDIETIAAETPDDPSTWQLTEADKMFVKVIDAFHQRGIKVILDYSFNHTGKSFWAWQDILQNQEQSKYKDWYWIDSFDDPETPENEFKYHGWAGVHELPEIRETQKQDLSVSVNAFEGNIYSEAVKQHIFSLTQRWLDPNGDGDPSDGVDGYRLDVAAETPLGFWRDFRKHVRGINPNAYLLGEIWWEEWPDKLLDPAPFLQGDVFDAVMNYRWYRSARHFFNASPDKIPVSRLVDSLNAFKSNIRNGNTYAMMNLNGGFDTPRVLTSLSNKNKYKYHCNTKEDPNYHIGKPTEETVQTLKLLLAHQYTYIGAPHIWAGDEMGMWGADDPSCRKPLIWPDYTFEDEQVHPLGIERPGDKVELNRELLNYYQKLIAMRKAHPVLVHGDLAFIPINDEVLAYRRFDEDSEIIAVFNASNSAQEVQLPVSSAGSYKDILNGTDVAVEGEQMLMTLPGRSAVVLSRCN